MLEEDFCSYEVAKLLKGKGFNEYCLKNYWSSDKELHDWKWELSYNRNSDGNGNTKDCAAPTHQMAMKWLREVYHIEINITFGFPFINGKQQYKYFWSIVRVCDNHLEYPMDDPESAYYNEEMADYYKEAIEAALKYCLENLI